jgi:hypothetical protein
MQTGWKWASLISILMLNGCTTLPNIDKNSCGNGVIDPGEDCDGFPAGQCVKAGQENQCHLSCNTTIDPSFTCPVAWSCGLDYFCRRGSGNFTLSENIDQSGVQRLAVADFDSDGRGDIVSATNSAVHIHFTNKVGGQDSSLTLPFRSLAMVIGNLGGEGQTNRDLVIPTSGGFNVFQGESDRDLAAIPYSATLNGVSPDQVQLVSMDAMPSGGTTNGSPFLGDELMVIAGDKLYRVASDNKSTFSDETFLTNMPGIKSNLAGKPAVGHLDLNSKCDQMALGYVGQNSVWIYSPCALNSGTNSYEWNKQDSNSSLKKSYPSVTLNGGGKISEGVLLADLNFDGALDMLIGATASNPNLCAQAVGETASDVYIAFGAGNGTFNSKAPDNLQMVGDNIANKVNETALCVFPLVIGPLDVGTYNSNLNTFEPTCLDIVTPRTILVSLSPKDKCFEANSYGISYLNRETGWTQAFLADFNSNGIADIIGVQKDAQKIDFMNGTGAGVFNRSSFFTNGSPIGFALGDFDGDLLKDFAYFERFPKTSATDTNTDEVSIAFASSNGAFNDPISMGAFKPIQQILPGLLPTSSGLDAMSDLLVVSSTNTENQAALAILNGSADRKLVAPFLLDSGTSSSNNLEVVRLVVGQFDFDGKGHQDITALVADFSVSKSMPKTEGAPEGLSSLKLTMIPSKDNAVLDSSEVFKSGDLDPTFRADYSLLIPMDLDGDANDELVIFSPQASVDQANPQSEMRIARVDGMSKIWSWSESQQSREYYLFNEQSSGRFGTKLGTNNGSDFRGVNSKYMLNDINHDGKKDLFILSGTINDQQTSRLVLFLNQGTGTLNTADSIVFQTPDDWNIVSFTMVNVDGDTDEEVVFAKKNGELVLADLDIPNAQITNVKEIVGGQQTVQGINDVVATDIDGDGIVDLATSSISGVKFFIQKAGGQ